MLNRNMTDSIARDNIVSSEDRGIVISESHDIKVYNNTVSSSGSGMDLDKDSSRNSIHDNTIINISDPEDALGIEEGTQQQNSLYSNTVVNPSSEEDILLWMINSMSMMEMNMGNDHVDTHMNKR